MILNHLSLQNFRNYSKSEFTFNDNITVIVGSNASGKTNLLESIVLLATGKSFKSEKEKQLIHFGKQAARVKGKITLMEETEGTKETEETKGLDEEELEVTIAEAPTQFMQKRYLVNGVSKRRVDFAGRLQVVLFTPLDLEIVAVQPASRRNYLNDVLEPVDSDYRLALASYTKALRQRNALLEQVQKTGHRDQERFAYWDELLIANGQIITHKREALLAFINAAEKKLFPFTLLYDRSTVSGERLLQYKDAEIGAGVTLVGPHRDDVLIQTYHEGSKDFEDVKYFSSRGQQRLVTLELKQLQISYMQHQTQTLPVLLLDDIFSELDNSHIKHVLEMIYNNQTIITTTHHEFIDTLPKEKRNVIE
ncbi:MAG: DNA replication/repair protein RecF, partial [Candidatus Levyibacteriota bacterium]